MSRLYLSRLRLFDCKW